MVKEGLKERWFKAWQEFQIAEDSLDTGHGDRIWQLLSSAYRQPDRFYHNLSHIQACLQWLDLARSESGLPQPNQFYLRVEMALWFHDVVYNPQSHDNEEQSSQLFAEVANSVGIPLEFSDRVAHLILVTKTHTIAALPEEKLISDCDLAILGASAREYDLYARNIRQEYSFVEESIYRQARSQILKNFLMRENIFQLPFFQKTLEVQARENLQQELSKWA
jgi:predicted metal-dependent HD superfamily phosphohydrolase